MDFNSIYNNAFADELEKLGLKLPRPSAIMRTTNYIKSIKEKYNEKYKNKKKRKNSKSGFLSFRSLKWPF